MKTNMTERDKKLLVFMFMIVIIVGIGYWGVIPQIKAANSYSSKAEDEEAEKKILLKKLRICLSKLSAEQQELVQDIFFKFLTEQEVAQKLGISQSAVSQRKNTVLRKLRNLIECSED